MCNQCSPDCFDCMGCPCKCHLLKLFEPLASDHGAHWDISIEDMKEDIADLSQPNQQELYEWMHKTLGLRIYK